MSRPQVIFPICQVAVALTALPFQRKHLDGLEPGETRERGGKMAIGAKLRCKSLTSMAYCMDTIGSSHSQETNMPLPFTDPET
jgi:hypothetical protein